MAGGGTPSMITQTSTTEPWDQQKKYLTGGFKRAADIYNAGFPEYYPGETLAGFDPSEQMYQNAVQGYVTGDRAVAQQAGAEDRLLKGMSGEIDYSTFDPMMDYLGRQSVSQLQGQVLPGIRSQMIGYQPGGGTRGNLIQQKAIETANQQLLDKQAQLTYGAQQAAQNRALSYLGQYPTTMQAPINLFSSLGQIGAQRRAMTQAQIDRDMARYEYEANAPMNALKNYMALVSGDYGSSTTQTTPYQGPSGLEQAGQIAGIIGSIAPLFAASDERLKKDIEFIGKSVNGYNLYTWKWNEEAKRIGVHNEPTMGVMAQEVLGTKPDAVIKGSDGYYRVNYSEIF
jgi:hypothetical protein